MADADKQTLDQKLDGLDNNLEPLKKDGDDKPDEEKIDEAEEGKETDKKEESQDGDDKKEPAEGDKEEDKPDDAGEEEGYTIDEGEEGEEKPADKPDDKPDTSQLSPEQQYILDNVTPITVKGTVGDDKVKEFKVLAPEQLPSGFKFADDVEMSKANKGFNMLEQRATQLQTDFRTQQTDKAAKDFKEREDTADRQDIAALQKAGTLPKFKAQPNSAEFDKDPGVKQVQDILDFKDSQNKKYMDEYNAGRPYKHIGFEEAFAMFKRESPKETAQAKEDKERLDASKRTTRPAGNGSGQETQKARVHSGMTSRDLDNLIEGLDW